MKRSNYKFISSVNFKSIAKKASAGFLATLIAMGGSSVYAGGGDKDKKPKRNVDTNTILDAEKYRWIFPRKIREAEEIKNVELAILKMIKVKKELMEELSCETKIHSSLLLKSTEEEIKQFYKDQLKSINDFDKSLNPPVTICGQMEEVEKWLLDFGLAHDVGILYKIVDLWLKKRGVEVSCVKLDEWLKIKGLPCEEKYIMEYVGKLNFLYENYLAKKG